MTVANVVGCVVGGIIVAIGIVQLWRPRSVLAWLEEQRVDLFGGRFTPERTVNGIRLTGVCCVVLGALMIGLGATGQF